MNLLTKKSRNLFPGVDLAKKHHLILTLQGKLAVWLYKFFPGITDKLILHEMAKEPDAPF